MRADDPDDSHATAPLDLDAIAARAAAATQAPWVAATRGARVRVETRDVVPAEQGHVTVAEMMPGAVPDPQLRVNAAFISSARTDVPALVAEVRRLRSDRAALLAQLPKCWRPGCVEPATWVERRGVALACDEHPSAEFVELPHAGVVRALRWGDVAEGKNR